MRGWSSPVNGFNRVRPGFYLDSLVGAAALVIASNISCHELGPECIAKTVTT